MTTNHDTIQEYKRAIKGKFNEEKENEYSSFLLVPSRAQLRKLCIERFKNNTNVDDLKSFELFFGFEFNYGNKNKLQSATDKFRPIENFFKNESDLSEIESINMAAILVDLKSRPYNRFSKLNSNLIIDSSNKKEINDKIESANFASIQQISNVKKKIGIATFGLLGVFSVAYTAKNIAFPKKQCMQWMDDHYELIDCQNEQVGFTNYKTIKPYNEIEFERKELVVCDTTTFFKGNKSKIWYSKKNKIVQFFNLDGENPENDAELKKVSQHIIDTYVDSCK